MRDEIDRPVPPHRTATPRWMTWLALLLLAATFASSISAVLLVRDAEERQASARRAALVDTVDELRKSGFEVMIGNDDVLRRLERSAGLKDLRYEQEPETGDRTVHSVLDSAGRIIGWLSWQPERNSNTTATLTPLLALMALAVAAFAGIALWQVRRSNKALSASERRAWTAAHRDVLTGLPNYAKMMETIDIALQERATDEAVTLAFADIDGLAAINESNGHPFGDALLAFWAQRLADLLPERAACGRFDGDRFAILLPAADLDAARQTLAMLADALSEPFNIDGQQVAVECSIGLAQAESREDLIRRADLALRAAKRGERGGLVVFEPGMEAAYFEQTFIARDLRVALATNALDVHYQPIVSADGTRIIGAEALLRWTHPERGPIPPGQFVPVAETCGLMGRLGDFVLRRALEDAQRWPDLTIAVNLSPVQVRDRALVEHVETLLKQTGIAPSRLELEITEGVLIDNPDEAQERLDALHALGVKLSLDDFGTGYSGLTYLQRFRFDKLKIDRGFVAPLGQTAEAQAMVQAIVAMGRALGLTTLAEGVETEEQRVLLRLAGCDEMQGYLFAKPAPRETLDRWITERPEAPTARVA